MALAISAANTWKYHTTEIPALHYVNGLGDHVRVRYILCLFYRKHYRQTSNISRTKYKILIVSRLVLKLSLPNPRKPGVKSRMKM